MKWRSRLSWIIFLAGAVFLLSSFLPSLVIWYWSWLIRPPVLFDPAQVSQYPIPKILSPKSQYQDLLLTDASAWFPASLPSTVSASPVSAFLISFPSLKISDLSVKVNGTDLKAGPVHYPGSALPGEIGNTIILGHSALPQFYLFGSSLTVFNPLLRLKVNDRVNIDFNGFRYSYQINKIFEVTPDHIEVLSQPDDRRKLTLITCVPLGTYLRRLVIVGDLVN